MFLNIPTSKDIYIEIDGNKVAVVESYKAKSARSTTLIEEFGNAQPIAAIRGRTTHQLELKRVYFLSQGKSDIDFHALSNFTIVIVKPNSRILYIGCEWDSITEGVSLNQPCIETVTVVAAKRTEMRLSHE